MLRRCLQQLDPNYTVFRDVTESENESIDVGDNWEASINRELDKCDCCVVILVPAIFERPQCVREIEYFNRRIANAENCFFFPVAVLPVADEFKRRLSQGHSVAQILNVRHHFDFTDTWFETHPNLYKKAVTKIASRIHKTIRGFEKKKPPSSIPDCKPFDPYLIVLRLF